MTNFSGSVALSLTNAAAALTPAVSGAFVQGVWTGQASVSQAAAGFQLVARDAAGRSGISNPFDVAAAPQLSISLSSSNLVLAWPAGAPGLFLESSSSLSPPAWAPVTNPPSQTGDQLVLPLDGAQPQLFYRLHYTSP